MKPDKTDFEAFGWETPERDNPLLTARCLVEQLSLIGLVLVQIRDALQNPRIE